MTDVTVSVSKPYHVIGFQGRRYGASDYQRRDYTGTYEGTFYKQTSKNEIQRVIRQAAYRATGSSKVNFTFVYV